MLRQSSEAFTYAFIAYCSCIYIVLKAWIFFLITFGIIQCNMKCHHVESVSVFKCKISGCSYIVEASENTVGRLIVFKHTSFAIVRFTVLKCSFVILDDHGIPDEGFRMTVVNCSYVILDDLDDHNV